VRDAECVTGGVIESDGDCVAVWETDAVPAGVAGAAYDHARPTLPPAFDLNNPTSAVNDELLNADTATMLDTELVQPAGALSSLPARQPKLTASEPQPVPT
jgi:hypothetical protein